MYIVCSPGTERLEMLSASSLKVWQVSSSMTSTTIVAFIRPEFQVSPTSRCLQTYTSSTERFRGVHGAFSVRLRYIADDRGPWVEPLGAPLTRYTILSLYFFFGEAFSLAPTGRSVRLSLLPLPSHYLCPSLSHHSIQSTRSQDVVSSYDMSPPFAVAFRMPLSSRMVESIRVFVSYVTDLQLRSTPIRPPPLIDHTSSLLCQPF